MMNTILTYGRSLDPVHIEIKKKKKLIILIFISFRPYDELKINVISWFKSRKLNIKILDDIKREISQLKLSVLDVFDDLNDYWSALKLLILNIINELAPLKKFKKSKSLPWIDKECLHLIAERDVAHQRACLTGSNRDSSEWKLFREARNRVKSIIKNKKNDYFLNKNSYFFKSSKKFWCFYKHFVKSKKSGSSKIDLIELDDGRKLN